MVRIKLFIICITIIFGILTCLKNPLLTQGQTYSQKSDPFVRWLPNREIPGINFVGSQACTQCHKIESIAHSSMTHALVKPDNSRFLNNFPAAVFQNEGYSYRIEKRESGLVYIVSDGAKEIIEPILYAFGEGRAGQVYVFRHNDKLYESKVSFYSQPMKLDFTVAQSRDKPVSLEEALGRAVPADEISSCFSCHSTGAIRNRKLQLETMEYGVNCEACHGPGEKHIAAINNSETENLQIFNPARMDPLSLSQDFCGSCHVGFDKVLDMPEGTNTIRFQPYRLFNSAAHSNNALTSCTACHNPHEKLNADLKSYDTNCTVCHTIKDEPAKSSIQTAPPCPVKQENCVTCHMPKTEIPEMHFKFTDHWIRIVKDTTAKSH